MIYKPIFGGVEFLGLCAIAKSKVAIAAALGFSTGLKIEKSVRVRPTPSSSLAIAQTNFSKKDCLTSNQTDYGGNLGPGAGPILPA